jgi:hypothetical protein
VYEEVPSVYRCCLGLAGAANAADLAVKAAPYVAQTYDWSGFYVGGFVGGGWSTNDASEPDLGIIGIVTTSISATRRLRLAEQFFPVSLVWGHRRSAGLAHHPTGQGGREVALPAERLVIHDKYHV